MGISKNNLKLIKAFIERSKADIKSANSLLQTGNYADSAYHSQQAAEKIVKCVLIVNNKFVRTHIVSGLFQEVINRESEKWKKGLSVINQLVLDLEVHWVRPRYPEEENGEIWNPVKEYTKQDAKNALGKAKKVVAQIQKYLTERYGITGKT